jgi:acyl-CoA reductase-like NAD-dependent aldehyde dehydrogenase
VTRLSVLNPATEQPIVELDEAGVEEADEAVARAKAAFPAWRDVAPAARAGLLRKVATLVDENAEELARIESENVGKPIAGARAGDRHGRERLPLLLGRRRLWSSRMRRRTAFQVDLDAGRRKSSACRPRDRLGRPLDQLE